MTASARSLCASRRPRRAALAHAALGDCVAPIAQLLHVEQPGGGLLPPAAGIVATEHYGALQQPRAVELVLQIQQQEGVYVAPEGACRRGALAALTPPEPHEVDLRQHKNRRAAAERPLAVHAEQVVEHGVGLAAEASQKIVGFAVDGGGRSAVAPTEFVPFGQLRITAREVSYAAFDGLVEASQQRSAAA
jgi:hypothetical protein